MVSQSLMNYMGYLEIAICLAALCFLTVKRQWRDYWATGSFLAVRAVADSILTLLWHSIYGQDHHKNHHTAYLAYFYIYWTTFAIESLLALSIVYSIYRLTMKPLKGLQRFGSIFFCVVAGITVVATVGWTFASYSMGPRFFIAATSYLQRNQSLLTLCMLLVVFCAMRPTGISGGSKIFGVGLGLGVLAACDLVRTWWLAAHLNMYRTYSAINGVVICAILLLWTAYFALPEPERREIDVRSPLLRWNRMLLNRASS